MFHSVLLFLKNDKKQPYSSVALNIHIHFDPKPERKGKHKKLPLKFTNTSGIMNRF